MAQKLEAAYRTKLTEAQARKIVSDIYEQIHGDQLYHATARKFLTDWMTNKKSETSPGTYKRYQNAVDKLIDFSGSAQTRISPTSTNATLPLCATRRRLI